MKALYKKYKKGVVAFVGTVATYLVTTQAPETKPYQIGAAVISVLTIFGVIKAKNEVV